MAASAMSVPDIAQHAHSHSLLQYSTSLRKKDGESAHIPGTDSTHSVLAPGSPYPRSVPTSRRTVRDIARIAVPDIVCGSTRHLVWQYRTSRIDHAMSVPDMA
eukprot:1306280-Rhodomonas_salina.2